MLQEAGFHPLEVIQAATMNGALTLNEWTRGAGGAVVPNKAIEFGVVKAGMLADMVIVDRNPLQNFKVLYGTGHLKLNDQTQRVERVGGVRYTIKDGIVYDAKKLLEEVAAMVGKQKRERVTPASGR
jgi:imidazolonepropionase-like amidohydrolase